MTDEQQRIAIAEACGWKPKFYQCGDPDCEVCGRPMGAHETKPPDYPHDLNAMHDVELTMLLTGVEWVKRWSDYMAILHWISSKADPVDTSANATAAQRAEAFLRTKGLWK